MSIENCKLCGGFTLLEILLSISVVAFLAVLSLTAYRTLQIRTDLENAAAISAQLLRRAQLASQAVEGDMPWGVYVTTGSLTLFRGPNYLSRDAPFDEIFETSNTITPSGLTEVTFSKVFGEPNTTGTLTLTAENLSRTITINTKGMILW